jgi:hypothetical protein
MSIHCHLELKPRFDSRYIFRGVGKPCHISISTVVSADARYLVGTIVYEYIRNSELRIQVMTVNIVV